MPPQILTDSESDGDVIPAKPIEQVQDVSDVEDEAEDIPDEDGEEYIVEAIKDHKYEGKKLFLLVKWKGYEKKSDMTWEPEENCEGAKEVLQEYYDGIGGRPTYKSSPAPSNKRNRQSIGSTPTTATKGTKRAKTSLSASKNGDDHSPAPTTDSKWKPPKGSWENEITAIDTIEKTDKGLVCYVQWGNGRKTQHDIHVVYSKCPQRMLQFYEQHLVFKESGSL